MSLFFSKHKKNIGDILVVSLIVLAFLFDSFHLVEHRLQDIVYQRPNSMGNPNIFVVGIDEWALDKFGPFQQWSRQYMADAINILNSNEDYKPAVIAIDILYIGESDNEEADANLAKAAQNGGNVVTVSNALFGYDQQNLSLNRVAIMHETPYEALAEHVSYGLGNAIFDSDGVIRNAILKTHYEEETIYSFPFMVYKKYTGRETNDFVQNNYSAYIAYSERPGGYYGLSGLGFSFADIFEEDFEPEFFADSIIFIGPYAAGLMDSYNTPVSAEAQMHGVEIHANVLQMMLEENFKTRVSNEISWLILILFTALAIFLARKTDIRIFLGIVVLLCVGYVLFAVWLFNTQGYILVLLYPLFAFVFIGTYQLIGGYILETLEKQKVKSAFKKYIDPKLVDKLMETGEANSDAIGVKKNIAVLFVDVRGFTPMSEALQDKPELIVQILNEYLELTTTAIFNNGGSVDKFIGDATMALFNGFVPLDDFEFRAVKAAWDIVNGAAELNASIKEKYNVDVGFGVGVNCGEAIVGNLGPSFRKDYTAIGDTVNTAARLESNAKRSQVLISKNVYDIVKDRVEATSIGEIPLKGKSVKLEIFSVTNIKAD